MMKFRSLTATVVLLFAVLAGATAASAQWRFLGSKEVNDRVDHDTINVGKYEGDFRRIQLRVENAPVRFYRVLITFGNGLTDEVQVKQLIRAGGSTRAINLRGRERVIRKLDIWYEAASLGRQKARVSLWGRD